MQSQRNFRYSTEGSWFKGNTHLHSLASDGGKSFVELADLYRSADYDFLFRTDHWVCSDVENDQRSYPLLWLDGCELDGWDEAGKLFHVVCLGKVQGIIREDGLEVAIEKARQQGALIFLAHPGWCGNTLDDCFRWKFDGVEIYNHVCYWLNGKSDGLPHWNDALGKNPEFLALAVDDTHLQPQHPGWNGGWVWIKTKQFNRKGILSAIRRGEYYSSCGPQINSLKFDGTNLDVVCSPIQFARLVGYRSNGKQIGNFERKLFDSFRFEIPKDWTYVYLEIEDDRGHRAWTNHLFRDE